ncbi:MAG: hypothetical protein ACXV3F_16015 [Frankiaceae bacterium]
MTKARAKMPTITGKNQPPGAGDDTPALVAAIGAPGGGLATSGGATFAVGVGDEVGSVDGVAPGDPDGLTGGCVSGAVFAGGTDLGSGGCAGAAGGACAG